ncbi:MAG: hypothetical protein HY238_02220 [Acidobacteria bacterium]|nr:hypothetical protein [Acidobacteriota bacterium]
MSDTQDSIVHEFERVADEAQTLTFVTRATELQEQACCVVDMFLEKLAACKSTCVNAQDEAGANRILAMELSLGAVRAELQMWIELKRDSPEAAWNSLISAQGACEAAVAVRQQIGIEVGGLTNLAEKLLFIERFVFPPQVFTSIGGAAGRRECSVCGKDYEMCEHIKGRAYMGQRCHTRLHDITRGEVSIVTNPANKLCRITHFSDQGKMRNRMTWRLEER